MWLSELLENKKFELIVVHHQTPRYSSLYRVNKDEVGQQLLTMINDHEDVWITPSPINE